MSRCFYIVILACLPVLWCDISASADTLRCQSVNGNINCAAPSGASCQTINGKTICISGNGDVVQSFGNGLSPDQSKNDNAGADVQDPSQESLQKSMMQQLDQIRRDGHLRTKWLSLDRN